MALRAIAAFVALFTFAISLWYLATQLNPSRANLSYWAENDDWGA
jgi:hypothetical protein